MKCSHCSRRMLKMHRHFRITYLEDNISITIVDCDYHYCSSCDEVLLSQESKEALIYALETAKPNDKIIIK